MVLTFNKKMMMASPGEGDSQEPVQPELPQEVYELPEIEHNMITSAMNIDSGLESFTVNALNCFSDAGVAMAPYSIRVNQKESKCAPIGYPRYYPKDYVEASKEESTDSLVPFPAVPGDPSNTPGV